ncbi:hypothetical protein HPB50_004198 [Hyalomma asiaticum]|uniref:Uncharacterized protein n=1 Tax=Hyalomma asiaticum TaxID=266040 RepID=A0ACB7SRP3_HYAAI|nr:hypothetical protein HPB50_004198 [Hyalomma asiaticum]
MDADVGGRIVVFGVPAVRARTPGRFHFTFFLFPLATAHNVKRTLCTISADVLLAPRGFGSRLRRSRHLRQQAPAAAVEREPTRAAAGAAGGGCAAARARLCQSLRPAHACPVGEAEDGREGRDARPEERAFLLPPRRRAACSLAFARWATARRRFSCRLSLSHPLQPKSSAPPEAPDDGAVQVALASPEKKKKRKRIIISTRGKATRGHDGHVIASPPKKFTREPSPRSSGESIKEMSERAARILPVARSVERFRHILEKLSSPRNRLASAALALAVAPWPCD